MQRFTFLVLALLCCSAQIFGQGTQVEFGKNRVQFHKDFAEWNQYESDNFITYWYGKGRNIGQATVQLAELDFLKVQSVLEHRINDKIQIIVYTDLTDLKQSNIGSEEAFTNTGGQTKIVGNKVFVYFNGDHNHLRRQIREGIATVYLNAMLFGSNLQEIVQNAVMMNLPEWFKDGLIAYVGEPWNTDLDNQLRDAVLSEDFEGFDQLAEDNPKLAGHSLWYFISENYGQATVSNLLYLTRINRSIDSGFLYVLGSTYGSTIDSWSLFFKQRYKAESDARNKPAGKQIEIKNKRQLPISQLKISPNGQYVTYVTNEIGKYKVYLHEVATGEREVILSGGFRNAFQATDYTYPLLAWNPSSLELAIMSERRDVVKLSLYDLTTRKLSGEEITTNYQRVHSIDYVDPITLVLSATVSGFSDLFLYFTNTRQTTRITQDIWDDLEARFVQVDNQRGILFASNRPDSILIPQRLDSILPVGNFDLFYYDLQNRSSELVRITNTPYANERQPLAIDTTYFSFLSDDSGIYNREVARLEEYIHHYDQVITLTDGSEVVLHVDSSLTSLDTSLIDTIEIKPVIKKRAIVHKNSNYSRNIVEQHAAPGIDRMVELVFKDGVHKAFIMPIKEDTIIAPGQTFYQQAKTRRALLSEVIQQQPPQQQTEINITVLEESKEPEIEEEDLPVEKLDTGKIDIDNYMFQSEFDDEEVPPTVVIEEEDIEEDGNIELVEPGETFPDPLVEQQLTAPRLQTTPPAVSETGVYKFRSSRIIPYRLKFRTDFVTTQLDNSLLFGGRESFTAGSVQDDITFPYPPPGILLKANFKDLFEDYEFEAGIRIPTTFNGAEYFLIFNDKKKRLDKSYAVYRKNQRETETDPPNINNNVPVRRDFSIVLGQYQLRYPLDIFRSFRGTFYLRRDKITDLSTEFVTLERPTITEQRMGARIEYVFDNTLDVALNIKNGSRYTIYYEAIKRFDLEIFDGLGLEFNRGFTSILGVDARHYQRLGKYPILALRFAGATSFGSNRLLYFLGGVDNWLIPRYNTEVPSPAPGDDIVFQTLATNLRGFRVNIRNGNSFALINAELRVPIFRVISKRIRSSFFRNFQTIGFFDIGTAWEGSSPFNDDNPLNTVFLNNGDLVQAKVNYFRDPIVAGYGVGVRTIIFGYFLRLDYAWGIETREILKPRLYVSLGMDF